MFSRSKPWEIAEPLANSPTRRILSRLFELPHSKSTPTFLQKSNRVASLNHRRQSTLTISTVSTTSTTSTAVEQSSDSYSDDAGNADTEHILGNEEEDKSTFTFGSPIILEEVEGGSDRWDSDSESTEVEPESPIDWVSRYDHASGASTGSSWGIAYGDMRDVEEFVLDRNAQDASLLIIPNHDPLSDTLKNTNSDSDVTPISPKSLFSVNIDNVFPSNTQQYETCIPASSIPLSLPYTAYSTPQSEIDQFYQSSELKSNLALPGKTNSCKPMNSHYNNQKSPLCTPSYPIEPYFDSPVFKYSDMGNETIPQSCSMQFGAPPDTSQLKSLIDDAVNICRSCPNSPRLGHQRRSSSPQLHIELSSSPSLRTQRHSSSPRPTRMICASSTPQSIFNSPPSPVSTQFDITTSHSDGIPIPFKSSRSVTPQSTPPASLLSQQLSQLSPSGSSSPSSRSPRHSRSNTVTSATTINALLNAAAAAAASHTTFLKSEKKKRESHSRIDDVNSTASEDLNETESLINEESKKSHEVFSESSFMYIDPTDVICAAAAAAKASSAITLAGGWPLTPANQLNVSGLYVHQYRALIDLRKVLQDVVNILDKTAAVQKCDRGTSMDGPGVKAEDFEPPPPAKYVVDGEVQTERMELIEMGVQTDEEINEEPGSILAQGAKHTSDVETDLIKKAPGEFELASEEVEETIEVETLIEEEIIEEIVATEEVWPSPTQVPQYEEEVVEEILYVDEAITNQELILPQNITPIIERLSTIEESETAAVIEKPSIATKSILVENEQEVAVTIVSGETAVEVDVVKTGTSGANSSTELLVRVVESIPETPNHDEAILDHRPAECIDDELIDEPTVATLARQGLPSARAVASKLELRLSIDSLNSTNASEIKESLPLSSATISYEYELESILRTPSKSKAPQKKLSFCSEKIEQVMFFDKEQAPSIIKESDYFTFFDLKDDERKHWRTQNYLSMRNFGLPIKVWGASNPIRLENISVTGRTVIGTLTVRSLAYHKRVFIRYTTDGWETYQDVVAHYQMNIRVPSAMGNEPSVDRFGYYIELTSVFDRIMQGPYNPTGESQVSVVMSFVICYEVNGTAYWDNNNGKNYEVLLGRAKLPENPKEFSSNNTKTSCKSQALPRSEPSARRTVNLRRASFPSTLNEPLMRNSGGYWEDPDEKMNPQTAANADSNYKYGTKYDFMKSMGRPTKIEPLSSLAEISRKFADKNGMSLSQPYLSGYTTRSLYAQHSFDSGLSTVNEMREGNENEREKDRGKEDSSISGTPRTLER